MILYPRTSVNRRTLTGKHHQANKTKPVVDEDAVFADGAGVMYSHRNGELLSAAEYGQVQSAWVDYTIREYQFFKRNNGSIIIDRDIDIVYTDDEGTPEYVLDVGTDNRWSNNDVYNMVFEMEKRV